MLELTLTLTLTQATFAQGEPINAQVRLRNSGGEAATVNGRLAVNTPYAPEEMREIAFTLTDPTGALVDFQVKVNIGAPGDTDFRTLAPGEAIAQSYNLAKYFALVLPGVYAVQALYQNQSEPEAHSGQGVWKGEVAAPAATFTVRA